MTKYYYTQWFPLKETEDISKIIIYTVPFPLKDLKKKLKVEAL